MDAPHRPTAHHAKPSRLASNNPEVLKVHFHLCSSVDLVSPVQLLKTLPLWRCRRVYQLDTFGACHLIGTGFTHVPMSAGSFEITCPTWRPAGTVHEDVKSFFLGTVVQQCSWKFCAAKLRFVDSGGSICLKPEHQDNILFDKVHISAIIWSVSLDFCPYNHFRHGKNDIV